MLQNTMAAPPSARAAKYATEAGLRFPTVTPIGAITMRFLSSMRPIRIGRDRIEAIIASYSLDHFCTAQPPSTGRQTPLMYLASSEHRYTTAQAASSGMPT